MKQPLGPWALGQWSAGADGTFHRIERIGWRWANEEQKSATVTLHAKCKATVEGLEANLTIVTDEQPTLLRCEACQ